MVKGSRKTKCAKCAKCGICKGCDKCKACSKRKNCQNKCKCKRRTYRNKKMKGGCGGCMMEQQGGKSKRRFTQKKMGGSDFGPASYTSSHDSYTYPINTHQVDPLHMQISSRNLPNMTGGSRRRRIKKGGYSLDRQFSNPVTSFMTSAGAVNAADTYSMKNHADPHSYSQPALDTKVALA